MEENKEETITLKKSSLWKISTFVLGVLLIISIVTGGFGFGKGNSGDTIVNDNPSNDNPSAPTIVRASIDDDPVLGDKNAPLTIIEFSDYQCPFCGRFWSTTLPLLKKNFIDTGKVKFVYRDFPLSSIHPFAQKAAEASECADEQGKFWEMHDKIFENQEAITIENLKSYASGLGLDTTKFNNCLDSGKYTKEIEKDFSDGNSYGVSGTPTFFIGNDKDGYKALGGAQPYQVFEQVLNSL